MAFILNTSRPIQFVDRNQYLSDLVNLGLPFVVLDIYARVSWPGCFEHRMARPVLSRFAEVFHAEPEQVGKSHVVGCAPHRFENLLRSRHPKYGTTIGTTLKSHF
jgi:hypothetical protein